MALWNAAVTDVYVIVTYSVFFFQAEDGIRDGHVTGVQTCALPISHYSLSVRTRSPLPGAETRITTGQQIGRASCRERVEVSGGAGGVKKKKHRLEGTPRPDDSQVYHGRPSLRRQAQLHDPGRPAWR